MYFFSSSFAGFGSGNHNGITVQLILASSSPRRMELLTQIGLSFKVVPVEIDETVDQSQDVEEIVRELAVEKSRACQELLESKGENTDIPILSADTLVSLSDRIVGKPVDRADAVRTLQSLSGTSHRVLSAVVVRVGSLVTSAVVSASVLMRKITPAEIEKYCDSNEPFDKAGSYGIQGVGGVFIEQIVGQPSTVAGLPLLETDELLRRVGVDTWQNRRVRTLN